MKTAGAKQCVMAYWPMCRKRKGKILHFLVCAEVHKKLMTLSVSMERNWRLREHG